MGVQLGSFRYDWSQGLSRTAQVADDGRRWPPGTRRDLDAISILVKVEIAARWCMCCEATYGRRQLHERVLRLP